MKKVLASLFIAVLALALPAAAQMRPKTIVRVFDVKVKSGMDQQFEEGVKKIRAWQKEHNYPLRSLTWSVISGDRGGDYIIPTFAANWKDFDAVEKFGPEMGKEIQADVGPYVESVVGSYWQEQPDLEANPSQVNPTPPNFLSVTTYYVKPGGADGMEDVIKQAKTAIEKTHWPAKIGEWYTLENGGKGSQILHVTWHQDWASFQPPEPSFGKMLSSVYGKEGSEAFFSKFVKSVHTWRTEIFHFRPELSYIPNSQ
jgi:hypothetical protein